MGLRGIGLGFKVIEYKDIVTFARSVDKYKLNTVRLSPYQAWLFRLKLGLMISAGDRCSFLRTILDTLKFLFVITTIFLTCPKVAFLGDYFDFDVKVLQRIEFQEVTGAVLIQFHPRTTAPPPAI